MCLLQKIKSVVLPADAPELLQADERLILLKKPEEKEEEEEGKRQEDYQRMLLPSEIRAEVLSYPVTVGYEELNAEEVEYCMTASLWNLDRYM